MINDETSKAGPRSGWNSSRSRATEKTTVVQKTDITD